MTQYTASTAPKQAQSALDFTAAWEAAWAATTPTGPFLDLGPWPEGAEEELAGSPPAPTSDGDGDDEVAHEEAEASRSVPAPETVRFGETAQKRRSGSVLVARPVSDWITEAATKPAPRRIFGDLWFEGELCILFAETNVGKSILAVQVADAITAGRSEVAGQPVEVMPQRVLYFDFELSSKQFHGRYSEDYGQPYAFDRRFIRVEVARDFDFEGDWTSAVHASIEETIEETGARIVIADNLTALQDETEQAKGALPLMRFLNTLKKRHGLSILVQAHTPKRDVSRPLTGNDLAGSRALLNLADSAFVIGASHREPPLRYLKQIKVRETVFTLDDSRVALLRLGKPGGFLSFAPEGHAPEADHLGSAEPAGTRKEKAADWLLAFLAGGPRPSEEVIEEGKKEGHSRNAVWEAKKTLGVKAEKLGFDGGWAWVLPAEEADPSNQADLPKRTVPGAGTLRDASAGGDGVAPDPEAVTLTASLPGASPAEVPHV